MKVLFLSVKTEKINMTALPFGVACVAAATRKAGHEVEMLDLSDKRDGLEMLTAVIAKFQPEIIGISVRNIDDQNIDNPRFLLVPIKTIVEGCRRLSNAKIVLGEAGYSFFQKAPFLFWGRIWESRGRERFLFLLCSQEWSSARDLKEWRAFI